MSNDGRQQLEELLADAINKLNLRGLLAKYGIAKEQPVKVELKYGNLLLASNQIPQTSNDNQIEFVGTDLRQEIIDGFLMKAERLLGLSDAVHKCGVPENEAEILMLEFSCGKLDNYESTSNLKISLFSVKVCPCGPLQCCWR